jgi:hypothetical protein
VSTPDRFRFMAERHPEAVAAAEDLAARFSRADPALVQRLVDAGDVRGLLRELGLDSASADRLHNQLRTAGRDVDDTFGRRRP